MTASQLDLFGGSVLPGLTYQEALITPDEECQLIEHIEGAGLTPFRFHGWTGKRETASFGWRYDFEGGSFGPTTSMPGWLMPFRDRAAAFADLSRDELVQALLIRYLPSVGVNWHRDRLVYEHIVGISLGAPATMQFRRRAGRGFQRASATLAPRSAYHLSGEVRHEWEHSIPDMDAPRWSITFRSLAQAGVGWDAKLKSSLNAR